MIRTSSSAPDISGYVIRRLGIGDAQEWAEYAVLPEAQRYTNSSVSHVQDLRDMIQRSLTDEADAPLLFGVRQPETHILLATFGFHTISSYNRTAEITYDVRPAYWGRGIATHLCQGAVQWAFREQGWLRVQATVLEPNAASRRVLEKSGFEYEALLRSFRLVRGEPKDYLMFAKCTPA
jgi:ribosomal-protein-alanine N-acetyltransferase